MDIRITVETTVEMGNKRKYELLRLSLSGQGHGDLGLKLEDAKDIFGQLQKAVLNAQIEDICEANRRCPTATAPDGFTTIGQGCSIRSSAGFGSAYRVFAPVRVARENAVRFRHLHSSCLIARRGNFRDYRQSWVQGIRSGKRPGSWRPSYPAQSNTTPPCAIDWAGSRKISPGRRAFNDASSSHPVTVLVDGAHIRCRPEYQKHHLDVVVGKIETGDMYRRFGLAPQAAASPATQLRRDLVAIGWNGRRSVTVISDGEAALPNLFRGATDGNVRHILDWWHISMRVQHVENAIKGLVQAEDFPGVAVIFKKPAETLRWYL